MERFDPSFDEPQRALSELTSAAAKLYLTQPRGRFVYLHALTGTRAVRNLLPWLLPDQQVAAVGYAFQAAAALHATHAEDNSWQSWSAETSAGSVDELRERVRGSVEEHTIKYVEAATSEYLLDPRPEYLAAAQHRLDAEP